MEIIVTSIVAFIATNIDDIFILTLFFSDGRYKARDIYIGQYLGIIALIALSVVGSLLGNFIDPKYIGLLGIFPIYLGVREIVSLLKGGDGDEDAESTVDTKAGARTLNVATVTFANGGDNIGVYIPLFASLSTAEKSVMIAIFLVLVWVCLVVASYLTKHPSLKKPIARYGHIITPLVLCGLGLYILYENRSFDLLK